VLACAAGTESLAAEPCPSLPRVTVYGDPSGLAVVCEAAQAALSFLSWMPLPAEASIDIERVQALPRGYSDAVGIFVVSTRRAVVLDLPVFIRRHRWFGVPVNASLYRGVVAHEVAHAAVASLVRERRISVAVHEYVAYVTLFSVLDQPTRQAMLDAVPGPGLRSMADIDNARYAADPIRFGADAWRHWQQQPDGPAFLRRLIDPAPSPGTPSD
jgi:hypothetical protein